MAQADGNLFKVYNRWRKLTVIIILSVLIVKVGLQIICKLKFYLGYAPGWPSG